jgi:hypothetical protein
MNDPEEEPNDPIIDFPVCSASIRVTKAIATVDHLQLHDYAPVV